MRGSDFADAHEIARSTYSTHEDGSRNLTIKAAGRYAPLLGVQASWLLHGTGQGPDDVTEAERLPPALTSRSPTIVVREYDVTAAAGPGAIPVLDGNNEAEIVAEWVVPRDFLPPQHRNGSIAVIRVNGDSMAPEIMPEERVLMACQSFVGTEGIYVLWNGFGVVIKRAQVLPGRLRLTSANPAYEAYDLPQDEAKVLGRIIGKWVWK